MEMNLLDKTEVWIDNVQLDEVNLTDLAAARSTLPELEAGYLEPGDSFEIVN